MDACSSLEGVEEEELQNVYLLAVLAETMLSLGSLKSRHYF